MATRYWVGGSGTWNTTNTANWSTTSGGAGGASVPTSADDVNIGSPGYGTNISLGSSVDCKSLTAGQVVFSTGSSAYRINVYGTISCPVISAPAIGFVVKGTGQLHITSFNSLTIDGVGITTTLSNNVTGGGYFTLLNGTLDLNAKYISITYQFYIGTGTKTLNIPAASSVRMQTFNVADLAGLTATGTGSLIFTSSTSYFYGSGIVCSYTIVGNEATTYVYGSNTVYNFTGGTNFRGFTFESGQTQTVTTFTANGFSTSVRATITATSTTPAILSQASGTNNLSFDAISYITATGGATWNAYLTNGNLNNGNNTGINFVPVRSSGLFFGSNF